MSRSGQNVTNVTLLWAFGIVTFVISSLGKSRVFSYFGAVTLCGLCNILSASPTQEMRQMRHDVTCSKIVPFSQSNPYAEPKNGMRHDRKSCLILNYKQLPH